MAELPVAGATNVLPAPDVVSNAHLWGVGIVLELLGTLFNVCGKQCIRYAQISGRGIFWFIGVVLWSVVYPVFDISALNFTPESTVFSVDGMIVVWNIMLAPYTLNEPITRSKLTAALVVTLGTLGAGAFGSHVDSATSADQYMEMLRSPGAVLYYFLFCGVVVGGLLLLRRHDPRTKLSGLLMGVLAGWFGGCAFFVKVLIQFVREDAWDSFWLYLFLILTIGYMSAAVWMVSRALRCHESVYIVPIYEGVLIINGAVNGYLVLHDGEGERALNTFLYMVSVSVILLGLYLIVWWPTHLLGDGETRVAALDFLLRPVDGHDPTKGALEIPGDAAGAPPVASAVAPAADENSCLVGERRSHSRTPLELLETARRRGICYCACGIPCLERDEAREA